MWQDEPEVAEAKSSFDELYRKALSGNCLIELIY